MARAMFGSRVIWSTFAEICLNPRLSRTPTAGSIKGDVKRKNSPDEIGETAATDTRYGQEGLGGRKNILRTGHMNSLPRAIILFSLTLVIFSAPDSYGETGGCSVSTRISIDNLRYRMLTPQPDGDRIRRGFEELVAINAHCSTVKVRLSTEDCTGMTEVSRSLELTSIDGLVTFERITRCRLSPSQENSAEKQPDINALITQTLHEQQESDGEASYWIADDLLALFLVYPEKVLENLEANPSFRQRFIADLGGNALEDLDDQPGSQHLAVREKRHVLAQVLAHLRGNTKNSSERNRILSEIARACGCGPRAHSPTKSRRTGGPPNSASTTTVRVPYPFALFAKGWDYNVVHGTRSEADSPRRRLAVHQLLMLSPSAHRLTSFASSISLRFN